MRIARVAGNRNGSLGDGLFFPFGRDGFQIPWADAEGGALEVSFQGGVTVLLSGSDLSFFRLESFVRIKVPALMTNAMEISQAAHTAPERFQSVTIMYLFRW